MKIFPVSVYQQKNNSLKHQSFGVNLASPELSYELRDFFVNIEGYGKDTEWAKMVKKATNQTVVLIRNGAFFEDVLHHIAEGARNANSKLNNTKDNEKKEYTGILRCARPGWEHSYKIENCNLYTHYGFYGGNKYNTYSRSLNHVADFPLVNPYNNKIALSKTVKSPSGLYDYILHGGSELIGNALHYTEKIYNNIQSNYVKRKVKNKDLKQVNRKMARMRWILAHSTPWVRGSDLIANMLMRALYKSMGIKSYPIAKGVSLDMEAYCTPMEKYVKNFPSYFEHEPVIPK